MPISDSWRLAPATVVLLAGFVGGFALGVVGRAWMRFVTTEAEFTWTGTGFIVGAFALAGLAQAGALLGRRAGLRRRWLTPLRIVTTAALLPLGTAAGAPLLPTILLAPLALTQRSWRPWVRWLFAALALAPFVRVALSLFQDLSFGRALLGLVGMTLIYAVLVAAACCSLAPQPDGWRAPAALRAFGAVCAVLVVGFEVLLLATFEN